MIDPTYQKQAAQIAELREQNKQLTQTCRSLETALKRAHDALAKALLDIARSKKS